MKTTIFIFCTVFLHCFFCITVYSEPILTDSATRAVTEYFNRIHSLTGKEQYMPEDLNRRFEIINLLTGQRLERDGTLENGIIYNCELYGDDLYGIYLVIDEHVPSLFEIENQLQVERARLYMKRYNYTPEQMDRCFEFFTENYIYENSFFNYYELRKGKDFIEYEKERKKHQK